VGLGVLNQNEEQFHFGMWALHKSPLVIGCPTDGSTNAASIKTLSNAEVIAINQDSLGAQARLVRRFTEEQYDIYVGNLSSSRLVVGIANWGSSSQSITLNVSDVMGVASASARDVWAKTNATISGMYNTTLAGHQLQILVLSNVTVSNSSTRSTGYHAASGASLSGGASVTGCSSSQCLPVNKKVTSIGTVTFSGVSTARAGWHIVGVDFCNYDTAVSSAWSGGTNTRNMTVQVNSGTQKRWAFPISGGDWFETGRLIVELDGFSAGTNTVTFRASSGPTPDLVGFEVYE
jgi:alpha-galactosidase